MYRAILVFLAIVTSVGWLRADDASITYTVSVPAPQTQHPTAAQLEIRTKWFKQ